MTCPLASGPANKMKVLTIHGVPYLTNEKNEVFLYQSSQDSSQPHLIGSWDPAQQKLILQEEWKEAAQAFVDKYRGTLRASTEEAMERARELQGVSS